MVLPSSTPQFIVLFILLLLSAFFSASETALTSLSKIRLRNMLESNVKGADLVDKVVSDPRKLLSSILIGNNIANIGASALATSIAIHYSGNNSVAIGIATGALTLVILIFSEITPKTMASQNSESISLFVARPISLIVFLLSPIVMVLSFITGFLASIFGFDGKKNAPLITESELKTMVTMSHEEGVLETDERTMINNVVNFGDYQAEDIMIPRTDILAVPDDISYEELINIFQEEGFSRIPVYKDSIDNIIGIVYLKDVVFANYTVESFDIKPYIREAYFTYESKSTSELFAIMRTKRIPMAIILDEYGGTSGLITLEDLIEQIVGDISDEYDEEDSQIIVVKEDEFIVNGITKINEVNEMIGVNLVSQDFDSIGGYVMGILGHIPDNGEIVEDSDIKFVVEAIEKNRISKLRIFT